MVIIGESLQRQYIEEETIMVNIKKKYTVLVTNGIFEAQNMMVVKSAGSEFVYRYETTITPDVLHKELAGNNISIDDCEIIILGRTWDEGTPEMQIG